MIRIAICQIDTTIGDFIHNVDKIADFLLRAGKEGAQLALFPELCVSSYAPLDLVEREDFLDANDQALKHLQDILRKKKKELPELVVVGALERNPTFVGRPIFNSAYIFQNGELLATSAKRLLPTYDVFDEARYFEPGKKSKVLEVAFGSGEKARIGISICEDAWFEDVPVGGHKRYPQDPAADLLDAELVLNLSASPFEMNKCERRQAEISGFAKRIGVPVVYANQVGANDEILFDGSSLVFDAAGKKVLESKAWQESLDLIDWDKAGKKIAPAMKDHGKTARADNARGSDAIALLHDGLVLGIRDYFSKSGFSKAALGLSGGIDSAVVAALAVEALGARNVLGVAMPGPHSSSHSLADAEELAMKLGLEYRTHSIKFLNSTLLMELKPAFGGLPPDVTEENIQSRLRALLLTSLANKRRALLLSTGNKSELAVGYCTTYGDMAGALAPIGDLYKTRVYALAQEINRRTNGAIPHSTVTKVPSAELRPNQTDQDTLPPYDVLDAVLEAYFEGGKGCEEIAASGVDAATVKKVLDLIRLSEFKRRQAAPVLKVSSKAFGLGRRIPIVRRF